MIQMPPHTPPKKSHYSSSLQDNDGAEMHTWESRNNKDKIWGKKIPSEEGPVGEGSVGGRRRQ